MQDITTDMFRQLGQHADQMAKDPAVRVVLLSGAGDQLYTVGADIHEMAVLARRDAATRRQGSRAWVEGVAADLARLEAMPKPVICAMKGISYGGGIEIAAACDIRVAAAGTRFAMPELRLGIIPGYGGTQRLERLIGPGATRLLVLTGTELDVAEAHRLGMVDVLAPAGGELARAEEVAAAILRQAPVAVAALKEILRRGADLPLHRATALNSRIFADVTASDDTQEGILAFVAKREPAWTGVCPQALRGFV